MRHRALVVVVLLLTAACSRDAATDATRRAPTGSTTSTAPTTTTAPPTTTTTAPPVAAAPAQAATPTCPPVPARLAPRDDRTRYVMAIDVRPAEQVVTGTTSVRFTPDQPTDRLVFRLWPNGPRLARVGAKLEVSDMTAGQTPLSPSQPDPTTLVVGLGGTLAANRTIQVDYAWRLTLPGAAQDRISRAGDTIRLGSFFPILAWEPGVGWAQDPPTTGFAEASTAPAADFAVSIGVPPGFSVLATGTPDGSGRWSASAVNDFAVAVGRFRTVTGTSAGGVRVTVGASEVPDAPEPYLRRVIESLDDFSRRYGPYPWPEYTLALTPALRGGIEYPMLVFQGPNTIGRTTSHEVAHMWFYGLVANNQGRDPWLDEGLATFAEGRFENALASMKARPIPPAGKGHLGKPMTFWDARSDAYYRSVYIQGAQALAALGDPDLVDCALRQFVARNAFRVAQRGDLVAALTTVFPDAEAVLARYGA